MDKELAAQEIIQNENAPIVTLGTMKRKKLEKHELKLFSIHWIAPMDWIDKLGSESFCLWLKLVTMADRSDVTRELDKVPTSISGLTKKLGVSKATFYKRIKPLYEYGLIDYVEYEDSKQKGQKPVNVVVFEAPWNDEENKTKPLVKLRSWEDRTLQQFPDALKGGRPKKENEIPKQEGISEPSTPVYDSKQGGVYDSKQGGVYDSKHINYLNNINNNLNPINNSLNVNNDVNKEVSNEVSNDVKEEVEKGIEKEFREKAEKASFEIYPDVRKKYGFSKETFLFLVNKIVQEKIDAGKAGEVYNVKGWLVGSFRNISNHRATQERLAEWRSQYNNQTNENEEEVAVTEEELSPQNNDDIQAEDSVPDEYVPTDEELLDLLNALRDKE